MLIREHALEKYWLERRLELLDLLDSYAQETIYDKDNEMTENDPRFQIIKKHYRDVINPGDLCDTIRSIYSAKNFRNNEE